MVIAAHIPAFTLPVPLPGQTHFNTGRLEALAEADAERRIAAFRAHWESLPKSGGSRVPHLRTFLDNPAPQLQPYVALIDLKSPEDLRIRLFGTGRAETFGRDLTGENALMLYPAERRGAIAAGVGLLAAHPCGQLTRRVVIPVKGVSLRVLSLTLPLATDAGASPCLANFTSPMDHLPPLFREAGHGDARQSTWIDLGAGVPDATPVG